jgi:hypothetical protein
MESCKLIGGRLLHWFDVSLRLCNLGAGKQPNPTEMTSDRYRSSLVPDLFMCCFANSYGHCRDKDHTRCRNYANRSGTRIEEVYNNYTHYTLTLICPATIKGSQRTLSLNQTWGNEKYHYQCILLMWKWIDTLSHCSQIYNQFTKPISTLPPKAEATPWKHFYPPPVRKSCSIQSQHAVTLFS